MKRLIYLAAIVVVLGLAVVQACGPRQTVFVVVTPTQQPIQIPAAEVPPAAPPIVPPPDNQQSAGVDNSEAKEPVTVIQEVQVVVPPAVEPSPISAPTEPPTAVPPPAQPNLVSASVNTESTTGSDGVPVYTLPKLAYRNYSVIMAGQNPTCSVTGLPGVTVEPFSSPILKMFLLPRDFTEGTVTANCTFSDGSTATSTIKLVASQ